MKFLGVAPGSPAGMLEPLPSRLPLSTSTNKLKRTLPMH